MLIENVNRLLTLVAVLAMASSASAVDISMRYRSPRNPERKVRQSTELIVLHTTEAPARSSLNKLSDRGEAHYCVTEEGEVYGIVDRDREAFHAGRSMWNGKEDVDKFSIGIEVVGYHDKAMGMVQIRTLADLVMELKSMYRITDDRVVCHSHVAYGAPNRWQKCRHRGRKRCGMLFAMPSVRRLLKLRLRPAYDPDTRARRLTVGDDYLNSVLYGKVDTMARYYGKATVQPKPPESSMAAAAKPPPAPKPETPAAKPTEPKPAEPKAVVRKIVSLPKTTAELKARGYVLKGVVSKDRTAMKIAGAKWNSADTYYIGNGRITPGNAINPKRIEKGMSIWMKK